MRQDKPPGIAPLLVFSWLLSPCAFPSSAAPSPPAPARPPAVGEARESRIRRLVASLDAADFAAREAASKTLVGIGEPALPALREALKTDNPEMQTRARAAIQAIEAPRLTHQKVLDRLYGTGAFVAGQTLPLRDALRPIEGMGLRVRYDKDVDPSRPVTLRKHGQTALELIDHLTETGGVGIRIVPGGVQIVPKALLDTLHRDLQQILEKPLDVDYEDTPLGEILKDLSVTVKATIVVSPAVSSRIKWTKQHFVFTKTLKLSYVLRLVMDSYELKQARVAYGLIVLSPD
jgi:hypothetical protein